MEIFSLLAGMWEMQNHLMIHPASTTHQQLRRRTKISQGLLLDFIRLSVGLEHIDDLIIDLEEALCNLYVSQRILLELFTLQIAKLPDLSNRRSSVH